MKKDRTLVSFDWALKSILRKKDNFGILEGFLSDLLNDNISIVELLESEGNQYYEIDKFNRVDLKAKDGRGREIIIEVQHDKEPDYLGRIYYGTSKTALENMRVGRKYADVKKIISVSIVYWKLLERSYLIKGSMKFEDMVNDYQEIKVKEAEDVFADYYFIQPEWFNDNIKSKIDEWVYLFKHSAVKGDVEATNIAMAREKLDELKMPEEERRAYEAYEAYELNNMINEGVIQVRVDETLEKMRQAMKAKGMGDDEINEIIKSVY